MPVLSMSRPRASRRLGSRLRSAATHDFCPALSRRVRRAVRQPPGMILLAAGVAGLCGLAVHPRVFALAGGLLAVADRPGGAGGRPVRPGPGGRGDGVGASAAVANHLP